MSPDAPLPTLRLKPGTAIAQAGPPASGAVTLQSPALAVMTDLTQVRAATVAPGVPLREAEQVMIYQGVRMLFVVGGMPAVEGLITSTDLRGERPLRLVQQRGVHFDELTVADVMTDLASLDAIDLDALKTATVGNLVATLRRHGRNHLLVVDGHASRVRGVVSRSQIERQLGSPIEVPELAHSFAELGQMLSS